MKTLTTITAIAFSISTAAYADPMPPASLTEAIQSPYVVLASYQSHGQVKGFTSEHLYLSGFTATYKLESILKQPSNGTTSVAQTGLRPGKNFDICYLVHDLSPCMADQSFHFSESLLPKKNTRWILFLTTKNKQEWQTYRGQYGRIEATAASVTNVKGLLPSI